MYFSLVFIVLILKEGKTLFFVDTQQKNISRGEILERLTRSTTEIQIHTAVYFVLWNGKKLNEISCDKKT
jgi:hypothetical protein